MRISSGVRGFDELIGGGFPEGRLYMISGPPGSGKTTFCAQFLAQGVEENHTCVFLSMDESKKEITEDMSSFDFEFSNYVKSGQIKFLNVFSEEGRRLLNESRSSGAPLNSKNVGERILRIAGSDGVDRIVIDSMMLLDNFFGSSDDNLVQFLTSLKQVDSTVLLVSEMSAPMSYADEQYLATGVIVFHNCMNESGMSRGIQVLKLRGTEVDCEVQDLEFSPTGITVSTEQKAIQS